MSKVKRRPGATVRMASEVGPGDWIKVGPEWYQIIMNESFGKELPRDGNWAIRSKGGTFSGWDIDAYAKDGDMMEA